MHGSRSLVGLVDLTLILLGSVALITEVQLRDASTSVALKLEKTAGSSKTISVPVAGLFEPGEARLSSQGSNWVAGLTQRNHGRRIAIAVAPETTRRAGRLDRWEKAAARTAAIMHALEDAGHPGDKIEPAMPLESDPATGVTILIRE